MGMPDGIALRCSAIVFRRQAVLLIHRTYDSVDDWVLPGGSPRAGESMAACARREAREETGLLVDPARVAFVLEAVGPEPGPHTVDIVFAATESTPDMQPEARERGMEPLFVPVAEMHELDLRPPLAGHLRGLLGGGGRRYAPYLANLWRPDAGRPGVIAHLLRLAVRILHEGAPFTTASHRLHGSRRRVGIDGPRWHTWERNG